MTTTSVTVPPAALKRFVQAQLDRHVPRLGADDGIGHRPIVFPCDEAARGPQWLEGPIAFDV